MMNCRAGCRVRTATRDTSLLTLIVISAATGVGEDREGV